MKNIEINTELVVVGGGMAGVVAAIAAARHGTQVVFIQDRPVLGGNASSEIRVWAGGAQAHTINRFAREGGITNEILMEQLHRNPHCSPPVWNGVLLDMVLNEPNIALLLDTAVDAVTMAEAGRIGRVSAYCSIAETRYSVGAPLFIDSSGDSIVGGLAGAEFRIGKEGRAEFGEPTAPEQPDPRCWGASLYFYSKDRGRPVPFVKPDFAIDVSQTARLRTRHIDGHIQGCHLWWIEFGGEFDTLHDAAMIKQKLTGIVYGFWDYIKNSGKFPEARNLDLEWVGPVPGKRESRRLMGPHILTEDDLWRQPNFPDSCATGGWTIDHHPPAGIFSAEPPSRHITLPGPYNIPLRTLFSRNVENLLMAGRNMSCSNVAFGSTRLINTAGVCGQAVGTAAAICLKKGLNPAQLVADPAAVEEFQQTLLRDDQHMMHVANRDPADQARAAAVTASSERLIDAAPADPRAEPLSAAKGDQWLMLPVTAPHLEHIDLLLDAASATTMELEVRRNDRRHHYFPNELVTARQVRLAKGKRQWVRVPLDLAMEQPANLWFVVKQNAKLSLHGSARRFTGALSSRGNREPFPVPRTALFAFRIAPAQAPYAAGNVINGFARPYVMPNLWASGERVGGGKKQCPWIELAWPEARTIRQVRLYLSHDPDMQIPTMMLDYPFQAIPTVLRELSVEVRVKGRMKTVATVRDNYRRMVIIDLKEPVTSDRLRVTARATNGSPQAEICEVRVY